MIECTREALLEAFAGVRTFAKKTQRAPHKHLLLLIALARVQRGEPRWIPYPVVLADLGELLARYSPFGRRTPENPYWRLRNDKGPLWEVRGTDELLRRSKVTNSSPTS